MNYVVGDVHGCYDDMMAMIDKIEKRDKEATIIFVGDFIDRGPKVWETLQWCMKNITPDGKYQSVLGNHEDMVLGWYYDSIAVNKTKISDFDPCEYGFERVLTENGIEKFQDVKPIIDFWETIPLYKKLSIDMVSGMKQDFIIAHAYVPRGGLDIPDEDEMHVRADYMWSRQHYWGYHGDEILVHGHTPTISHQYQLRGEVKPGFINYRRNAINVDGGCSFFPTHCEQAPCMLCCICLETLEEIYPYEWEDRMASRVHYEVVPYRMKDMSVAEYNEFEKKFRIEMFKEKLDRIGGDVPDRIDLLKRTGLYKRNL